MAGRKSPKLLGSVRLTDGVPITSLVRIKFCRGFSLYEVTMSLKNRTVLVSDQAAFQKVLPSVAGFTTGTNFVLAGANNAHICEFVDSESYDPNRTFSVHAADAANGAYIQINRDISLNFSMLLQRKVATSAGEFFLHFTEPEDITPGVEWQTDDHSFQPYVLPLDAGQSVINLAGSLSLPKGAALYIGTDEDSDGVNGSAIPIFTALTPE